MNKKLRKALVKLARTATGDKTLTMDGIKQKVIDMKPDGCNCSLRIKLVGDGCSVCNPEYWEDMRDD